MADRKFGSSDRGKRPFTPKRDSNRSDGDRPKRDYKDRSEGAGDRKAFKSKFTRKGSGGGSEDKPASKFSSRKEEGPSSAPRKRFSDRAGDDKKGFARKSGPGSYSRGGDKPSGFGRKKFEGSGDNDKRGGFSKGPRKDFDKPFGKRAEGDSFDKPRFGANRAFSSGKRFFKKKEEGTEGGSAERKRPFDKDSAPHRG